MHKIRMRLIRDDVRPTNRRKLPLLRSVGHKHSWVYHKVIKMNFILHYI